MDMTDCVAHTLEMLGISRRYRGHDIAAEAICRILKDEGGLICLHTQVYVPLCREGHQSCYQLERNLRTVIQRAWTVNRSLLQEMAAYPLRHMPTVGEFLDIVTTYLQRQVLRQSKGQ